METCERSARVPDEDLVGRCREGEEEAFSWLYERYRQRVLRTACRILRDPDEAQDAAQEIFFKVHRALTEWDPGKGSLSTWLFRLASNHAVDRFRMMRRRLRSQVPAFPDDLVLSRHSLVDDVPTPYYALMNKEKIDALRRCIRALPPLQKRLFILRYLHGMKLGEIAQSEHRSLATVKGLLFRSTHQVRRMLRNRLI